LRNSRAIEISCGHSNGSSADLLRTKFVAFALMLAVATAILLLEAVNVNGGIRAIPGTRTRFATLTGFGLVIHERERIEGRTEIKTRAHHDFIRRSHPGADDRGDNVPARSERKSAESKQ